MDRSVLQSLRLKGYSPDTLLDIGANVGDFTRMFLEVFPDTIPTLVEPNPYCREALSALPFEQLFVAASSENGTAEIFLTTEWLTSTGASLFRENTAFFRDDVVKKEVVDKARLDDLLAGRKFDFIKIDVQGGEYDVLAGGSQVIRQADYVLIELSVVEYNAGGAPAEIVYAKMAELGFSCREIVQFHRLAGVAGGGILQFDILFEKNVIRPTQNVRLAGLYQRDHVLDFLKAQKAACPTFSVIDVGAAANPWTAEVLDATFDASDCSVSPLQFKGNLNSMSDWQKVLQHVAQHGKFSYSICTHTLEDLAFPSLVMDMLPLISEAGFISVPSKHIELLRIEGPYRGFIHHRWIFCNRGKDEVVLVPKVPLVEHLLINNEDEWRSQPHLHELQIHWRKGLRYTMLNNDYLGPTAGAVVNMYSEILN